MIRAEEQRLAEGWVYEPPTFYEVNDACRHRFADEYRRAAPCRYVACGGDRCAPESGSSLPAA
jgi:hypothetical protein